MPGLQKYFDCGILRYHSRMSEQTNNSKAAARAASNDDRLLQDWLTSAQFSDWLLQACRDPASVLASGHQGVIVRKRHAGHDLAVKCASGSGLLRWARCWMLRREQLAYQRLHGITGIPRCHGMPLPWALVLQYVPGTAYRQAQLADRERWFEQLEQIVRAMHARGVSHGDLKRKANLLAGSDGQPWVLDLGTAIRRKAWWHVFNNWLFRQHCRADINAVLKHKYHGHYARIAGADRNKLQVTAAEWLWRKLRHWLGLQH